MSLLALNSPPPMTDFDLHLWGEGKHYHSHKKLGAHRCQQGDRNGVHFGVWAPNARAVHVMGSFNEWSRVAHPLPHFHGDSGIWSGFIADVEVGAAYKYCVQHRDRGYSERCDPYGFWSEVRPSNASRVWDFSLHDGWNDPEWMQARKRQDVRKSPMSVYEVHLGSWMRKMDNSWMTYRELAEFLVRHVVELGPTHVELMPVTEHPLDLSWGYQTTGYFSASSRFGSPADLRYLIDRFHQEGIGVILDWVPAHFPQDGHGLARFDGTHLFEHADPRQGFHPDWGTLIFNYSRNEVRNFLISSAMFWLEEYHIDGLRVDAVASMLYLDYGRQAGQWVPNVWGGRENIAAAQFLRELNRAIHDRHPDVFTVAEESTAYEGVTRSHQDGGLGFTFKWNMGWMHDTLEYFQKDPVYRRWHHNKLTFGMIYQYSEDFVLPFSHDEVVHLKKSMLSKMPGDEWQMRANLRALMAYMFGYPGKKLLFMGAEFGQWSEWSEAGALEWHLLAHPTHRGQLAYSRAMHQLYRKYPAFYELDNHPDGFRWLDCDDAPSNFLVFLRQAQSTQESLLFVCNFSPQARKTRLQLPWSGEWSLLLCSDEATFGGSGVVPFDPATKLQGEAIPHRGQPWSAEVTLPPLAAFVLSGHRPSAQPGLLGVAFPGTQKERPQGDAL